MSDDESHEIHLPHDKLFAAAFSVPENAAALLRAKLPPAVAEAVGWEKLATQPGSFVDSRFARSHTDILFSAPLAGTEGFVYVLFEHQSTPDPLLPLRLLRYMTRIWERCATDLPGGAKLPVILPVVLSQNAEVWHVADRLESLLDVPDALAGALAPYVPDFTFSHLQLADMAFDAIPGTPAGILVLRVMKAERVRDLLNDLVWDESVLDRTPLSLLQMVLRYMLSADIDRPGFERKIEALGNSQTRNSAMTLAQQYHRDGLEEGLQKGLEQGLERGLEQGLERGLGEGVVRGLRQGVLEALRLRFGHVPTGVSDAVTRVTDEDALHGLLRTAIRAGDLDEFAASL